MTLSHISQPGQAASAPLLLYLHGAGEVGGDPVQQLRKHGPWTNALYDPRNAYRSDTAAALRHFHVLAFHLQEGDWDGAALDAELMAYLAAHPAIDRGRLFLTGVSRGGRGVLRLAIQRLRAGRLVTAVAAFCPAGGAAEYPTRILCSCVRFRSASFTARRMRRFHSKGQPSCIVGSAALRRG